MEAPQIRCCRLLAMVCSCCWRRCRAVVAGLVCKGLTAFLQGQLPELMKLW